MMTHRGIEAAAAVALVASAAIGVGCSDNPAGPSIRDYKGPEVAVGAGLAWAESAFEGGELSSLALLFTPGALDDLPPTLPGTEYLIPLPGDAPGTVYDHIGINWQPEGHPPPMVYTHPHFDVHFYLISVAERDQITPADPTFEAKVAAMPSAEETPPRYAPDPMGIPRMGTHWTHIDSHEFHGSPFTNTMVYGFYDAKMIFIEPMITRAFLLSQADETKTIQVPQQYPAPGRYPTAYTVRHDAATGNYRVELNDIVTHD